MREFQFTEHLDETHVAEVNVMKNLHRVTKPDNQYPSDQSKKEVWFFGGSITFGSHVSNDETFCWVFQKAFPEYHVENFGNPAYSTVHSLIQLKDELDNSKRPYCAWLVFFSGHMHRNTCDRKWRSELLQAGNTPSLKYPYADLEKGKGLTIKTRTIQYRSFPLVEYSAFMTLLQQVFDGRKSRQMYNKQVTVEVIEKIAELTRQYNIRFILSNANLDSSTMEILDLFSKKGVETVNTAVDLNDPRYTFAPVDSHPNALAHSVMAQRMIEYFN